MNEVTKTNTVIYEFEEFKLNPSERLLFYGEKTLSLSPKVFDVLVYLVENNGRLVEKDELLEKLWSDTYIEEATLARTVSRLRKNLHENQDRQFIETVSKSGYRFIAPVNISEENLKLATSPNSETNPVEIKTETATGETGTNAEKSNNKPPTKDKIIENEGWFSKSYFILLPLALLLVITIAASFIWQSGERPVREVSAVRSIAVLPFNVLNGNEEDRPIGTGMAETLIIKLNGINQVMVRPSSSVSKYFGQENLDMPAIGRELQVDAILNGTVQKDGERLRVTVQLLNSTDGTSLWAEKFDAESKDIFALQDDISTRVTQALELKLTGAEKEQLTKRYTENEEAYKAYITGRYLWSKRNPDDFRKSLEYFQKAIEIDSNYALAYTGIADCYQLFPYYRMMPVNEGFAKARTAARKALEIDETLAEAHASLAYTLAFHDWDWEAAERSFKRAIELNPNYATAHQWYSEYLLIMGRFDESRKQIERAEELDPVSLAISADVASYYFLTKQYDKTIERSKKIIAAEPRYPIGYIFLLVGYREKGMEAEEVETYMKVAETFYGNSEAEIEELRNAYKQGGLRGLCLKRIEQMERASDSNVYLAWDYIGFYIRIGDKENALKWLEKSYQNRDRWITSLKYDPIYDPLRSDPRFQDVVRRIGLK